MLKYKKIKIGHKIMKQRSPVAVILLPFVTFGIYSLVWQVKTKNEMNQLGTEIPTVWLAVIPFVGLYWAWKYSEGVEKVTNGSTSAVLAFVLQFLLGSIGQGIIQNEFNKVGAGIIAGPAPSAPIGVQPDSSFGGPVAPGVSEAVSAPGSAQNYEPALPHPSIAPQVIAPTAAPTETPYAQPPQQS